MSISSLYHFTHIVHFYKCTQLDGLHMYVPLIIDYMALIGCMLSVHVAGYG